MLNYLSNIPLGASAAIIGYIGTNLLNPVSFVPTQPVAMLILTGIGIVASLAAGFIALLYGGYANWNWARSHDIARAHKWTHLYPDKPNLLANGKPKGLTAFATRLADPNCAPTRLAPIFLLFLVLSLLSALVHLAILIWSVAFIK